MNPDMKRHAKRWSWFVFWIVMFIGVSPLPAAMVYTHDKSGNVTRGYSSSTTALSGALSNSVRSVVAGGQLSLSVVAEGSGPFTYQWWFGSTAVTGATNSTYFKTNLSTFDGGSYSVTVSGANGSQTIQAGQIAVLPSANTVRPS